MTLKEYKSYLRLKNPVAKTWWYEPNGKRHLLKVGSIIPVGYLTPEEYWSIPGNSKNHKSCSNKGRKSYWNKEGVRFSLFSTDAKIKAENLMDKKEYAKLKKEKLKSA